MENLSNRGKSYSLTSMVSFFYTFPREWQDRRTMAFYDLLLGGSASDYCVPQGRGAPEQLRRRLGTHRFVINFKFPIFMKIVPDFFVGGRGHLYTGQRIELVLCTPSYQLLCSSCKMVDKRLLRVEIFNFFYIFIIWPDITFIDR